MAGGMRPTARARRVAVLRRAPNGRMMMRTVNIRNGLLNIREYDDNMQLRRGDIIFELALKPLFAFQLQLNHGFLSTNRVQLFEPRLNPQHSFLL